MVPLEALRTGTHVMTVCNSCRYCEAYCPVFPAMERRRTFSKGDLAYLANLCHNCGECLYACQYAPPHPFGINVPQALADLRVLSYQDYCFPRPLAAAFRQSTLFAVVGVPAALSVIMFLSSGSNQTSEPGNFYSVMSHNTMVTLFSIVSAFVVLALVVGAVRFRRAMRQTAAVRVSLSATLRAARAAFTLRHLHSADDGTNCTDGEESRAPWRRWAHHCTMYGFLLCFASTSVAAIYHSVFGWSAPYDFLSLPVVLGTVGGFALVVGPLGLLGLKARRDPDLVGTDRELDTPFIALLVLTSASGLVLLALRSTAWMPSLLVAHLAFVLTLFVMLPYGKFVHGLYRLLALVQSEAEAEAEAEAEVDASRPVAPA